MSQNLQTKKHPGRPGSIDENQYKRTYSFDVMLSPIEKEALKDAWKKSNFNSMAGFARYKMFGGDEQKIDLHFEEKKAEKLSASRLLAELSRESNNLNQITKQLNSKPEFMKQEVNLILKDLQKALDSINKIREEFLSEKKK